MLRNFEYHHIKNVSFCWQSWDNSLVNTNAHMSRPLSRTTICTYSISNLIPNWADTKTFLTRNNSSYPHKYIILFKSTQLLHWIWQQDLYSHRWLQTLFLKIFFSFLRSIVSSVHLAWWLPHLLSIWKIMSARDYNQQNLNDFKQIVLSV